MVRQFIGAVLMAMAPTQAADWIRMESLHFEIHTDTGETTARSVLSRFEQARNLLAGAEWWHDPGHSKLLVLLYGSERDYARLRPGSGVRGFYQSGPGRDYIAMLAGTDLDRIVLHEYTHSVLNHSSAPLPQWFEEGLAEVYSTFQNRANRSSVGGPIAEHMAALRRNEWFSGSELAAIGKNSPHYNEAGKTGLFYAQSWALTHMLSFAKGYREALPDYVEKLNDGKAAAEAFREAFGRSMDAAVEDLRAYAKLGFPGVSIESPTEDGLIFTKAEPLDPATAIQSRAEILLLMGRDAEAGSLYQQAARQYPGSPVARTGLAVLAVRSRDYERAQKLFEEAIELGARDASTYFEYAMLLRDTNAPRDRVDEFLEKAVEANPAHAEAHFLLGIRASDAGRYSDAIQHLRRATEVLPRQAYFWQALAMAHLQLGQRAEARAAAVRALRAARTDHEERMAEGAIRLIDTRETPDERLKPAVTTPNSWNSPAGDTALSGELVNVDCGSRPVRFHLRRDSSSLILLVKDPSRVRIKGRSPQQILPCGVQPPTRVLVEYTNDTLEISAIEFQ